MNQRIKVSIVGSNFINLITLTLWLDQFADFDVLGTTGSSEVVNAQIEEFAPDIVLLDLAAPGPTAISRLREMKALRKPPAVLLMHQGTSEDLRGPLINESDGHIGTESPLGDLRDAILLALKRNAVIARYPFCPVAKAG